MAESEEVAGRLGRPIADWTDPFDLDVHPAIESGVAGLPVLPAYVRRPHDDVLAGRLARAARTSTMAILVGESATGKTRACWEALRALPEGWRLWHPNAPDPAAAVLAGVALCGPRTVVWLNDIQDYLLAPVDRVREEVAAELRDLLRDPGRGPVLVLGTIWPRHWNTLTEYASPDEDPHARARKLLAGTEILVPKRFSPADLHQALAASRADPRIAEALEKEPDGHLTQYLAGGPALKRRYGTASAPARALMDAAIDARRLGHGPLLPRSLLLDAVHGYLSRQEWDMLDGDRWVDEAFGYVTDHRPCRGARAPLSPVRPVPGEPDDGEPRYRLADYLEQTGQAWRRTVPVPESLWRALLRHAKGGDLTRLGRQAQRRGLYGYALRLYRAAGESAPPATDAMLWAGDLLCGAGRPDEALPFYRRAGQGGDPYAWTRAAEVLREAGRIGEAFTSYELAAAGGMPYALTHAAEMYLAAGAGQDASACLRRAAATGDAETLGRVGELLLECGRPDEALDVLKAAAEAGDKAARHQAVDLMEDKAALAWLADLHARRPEDHGPGSDVSDTFRVATRRARNGDLDGAIELALASGSANPGVLRTTAQWLEQAERHAEAFDRYRRAAEKGDARALRSALKLWPAESRDEDGVRWLRALADAGGTGALLLALNVLLRTGRDREADAWLRARASAGRPQDAAALQLLASRLHERGRTAEAIAAYESFAGDPGVGGLRHKAELLLAVGRTDDAVACYRSAAERGDGDAVGRVTHILRGGGRAEQALAWLRSRAESGGGEAALRWVIDLYLLDGREDEALAWLRSRVEEGDLVALTWLANLLRDTGRPDEALRYHLRGAEAGMATLDSDDDDSGALALAAALLRAAGRRDEASRIVRYGVEPGGRIAAAEPGPRRTETGTVPA